jgi:hypothetical protein
MNFIHVFITFHLMYLLVVMNYQLMVENIHHRTVLIHVQDFYHRNNSFDPLVTDPFVSVVRMYVRE